jgi:hypothetical protein
MSKKEPKSAENMSAQEAVENLFHPKASGERQKAGRRREETEEERLLTLTLNRRCEFATCASVLKTNL